MGSIKGKNVKIELSSVSQIVADTKEINNRIATIEKQGAQLATMLADAIKAKRQLQDNVQGLVSMQSASKDDIDKFLKNAKELGIDASNQKEIKDLQALMPKIKEYGTWFNGIGTIPQI